MDDSRNGTRNRAIALVVRQFAPSRIERRLLAQVFDLVCDGQQEPLGCSAGQHADHQSFARGDRDLCAEPQLAGRATS